jgi:hypothetical protein
MTRDCLPDKARVVILGWGKVDPRLCCMSFRPGSVAGLVLGVWIGRDLRRESALEHGPGTS